MRNYWRYVGYVWRYKARVILSAVSSTLAELLNFASAVAFVAMVEILLSFHITGKPSQIASHKLLRNDFGRRVIAYLHEHANPAGVMMRTIALLGAGFLAVVALRAFLNFLRRYLLQSAALRGWTDMMTDLFTRITRLSARFFSQQSLGHTMSTFGPDTSELSAGGQVIFAHAVRDPVRLIIGFTATFAISWRLSLIVFVALPIALYVFKIIGDRIRRYTRKSLEQRADTMRVLGETLQGSAVIKAYGAEQYQIDRFRLSALKMLGYGLRRVMAQAISSPATEVLYMACRVAVLLYGARLVLTHQLAISELVAFVYAVKQVYEPLQKLRDLNNSIQRSRAAADRVFALMDLEPEVREKPHAAELPPHAEDIVFDHLCFAYDPPHEVIHDVHLTIRSGETVAFVGENGSGKSTLVKLLLRFYDPTSGSIRIDGTDLRDATLASLRGQIAYMPQEVVLFNDTVRSNIAFGSPRCTAEAVEAAARAALAHDFIVRELPDGYDTIVGEGGAKLSGGQRQRIALARALLRDPRILILDEPTSAMDAEVDDRVHDSLARFAEGRTVVLIAHRFSTLRRCDRIVAMAGGRIEHTGTHAELLASSPTYRNLHSKQQVHADA